MNILQKVFSVEEKFNLENQMTDQTRMFCCQCFATDVDGSWGHTVMGSYCTNCSSSGTAVEIPEAAVKSIRTQASWVGRRYYPSTEDRELRDELIKLRKAMPSMPGRTATHLDWEPGYWSVSQKKPGGLSVSCLFKARSAEEALRLSKGSLPYFSEEDLI